MTALRSTSSARWMALLMGVIAAIVLVTMILGFPGAQAQRDAKRPVDSLPSPRDMRADECMRSVREIYGRVVTAPSSDSVGTYRCRVEVIPKDSSRLRHTITDFDVINGAARLRVTSDLFALDRDSHDVFVVIPESKTVFRSDGRALLPSFAPSLDLAAVRDSLIERSLLLSCDERIDSAGHRIRTVRLSPDPHARSLYGLSEVVLVLDLEMRRVCAMTMVPYGDQLFDKVVWTFSPYTVVPADPEFRAPVTDRFLGDGGTLASEWRKFRLVDNRIPEGADQPRFGR